jgi:hypothetical protein
MPRPAAPSISSKNEEGEERSMRLSLLINAVVSGVGLLTLPVLAGVQVIPGEAVKLGELRTDETRTVSYQVVNQGTAPVSIRKIRSGCACTVAAEYPSAPIPPGGTAVVTLRVSGDKLAEGPFERTSIVEFNEAPPATLRFAGRSVHAVSVQPSREISLPPIAGPEQSWCQVVTVTGNFSGGQRLLLGKPEAGANVEVAVAEEAPSRYKITIRPRLPQPLGTLREEIRIPIAEPAGLMPEVVRIRGQVGPRLLALPPVIDLPAGEGGATAKLILKYAGAAGGMRVAAADLQLKLPPGVAQQSLTDLPEGGALLVLAFDASLRKSGGQGLLEAATAAAAPVRIPYYVVNPNPPKPTAIPAP